MRSMLESILGELSQIPAEKLSHAEPDEELKPGEVQVGTADEETQKGFYLLLSKSKEKEKLEADRRLCAPDVRQQLGREIDLLDERIDFLTQAFWVSVREKFPESKGGSGVGIRKGWQIVRMGEHNEGSRLIAMLRDSMGARHRDTKEGGD